MARCLWQQLRVRGSSSLLLTSATSPATVGGKLSPTQPSLVAPGPSTAACCGTRSRQLHNTLSVSAAADTLVPGLWTQCSTSSVATVSNYTPRGATAAHASSSAEQGDRGVRRGRGRGEEEPRFFPRRVLMYVPACDERKTKKAATLDIDTVVFDIEDGVALNQKAAARGLAGPAVAYSRESGCGPHQELVVRVNGVESGLMGADLEAVLGGSCDSSLAGGGVGGIPDSIMLPKCDSVEHLHLLDASLALYAHALPRPLPLHIIIESPSALLDLREILRFGTKASHHFTLSCVIFGSDDFLAAIGGTRTKTAQELLYARQSLVTHARAFGLDAVDLVDIDYKDLESLERQSEEGARMGFTGKQVIHPDQVPVVQRAFSPSPKQIEWAQGLIQAFHQHQTSGKGAFVYKGSAIDKPLLLQAENIVKLENIFSQQ